jgi:hypothetical protein
VLPPLTIGVDNATATWRAGDLDIQVVGFDNTYSAGSMSFTFYDLAGNRIAPGPVAASFTSDFQAYFGSAPGSGSAFQMRVDFPVIGTSQLIGSVDVQLSNAAGVTTIPRLTFQ